MKKRLCALFLVLVLLIPAAMASAAYYRVNTNWLKVHRLPDDNAKVLDSYRKDWALTIEKKYDDWSYVTFTNGKDGYVLTKYLKKGKSYAAWVTSDDTALRSGPAYSFSSVGTLAKGAKVTVLTHGSGYDYVSSTVGRGYVRTGALSTKKVKASGKKSTSATVAGSGESYDAYVVNPKNRTVNLRKGAGKNYGVINAYMPGTGVTVLEKGDTWSKVSIYGVTGYMMSEYLSTTKPAVPEADKPKPAGEADEKKDTVAPPFTAYVKSPNGKKVNIRNGAGMGYGVIGSKPVGSQVKVVAWVDRTWSKIETDGITGYMMSKYLTSQKPAEAPAESSAPPKTQIAPPYQATVTSPDGKGVNVHRGAGLGYANSDIGRLNVGTEVTVTAWVDNTWSKLEVNGKTGYIMTKYLRTK